MSGNDYICFALFIKLIVNNVKYGGIHYDYYGQLTNLLFLFPASQKSNEQEKNILTQYKNNGRVFNPSAEFILKRAGFTALVRQKWTGISRVSLAASLFIHRLLKSHLQGVERNRIEDVFFHRASMTSMACAAGEVNLTSSHRLVFGVQPGYGRYDKQKNIKWLIPVIIDFTREVSN
jgi:hypothetical protein